MDEFDQDEPGPGDLAAIEAQWPLIAAEEALVEAECRLLCAPGGPSELDWRRLRRARGRVAGEAARLRAPLPVVALVA